MQSPTIPTKRTQRRLQRTIKLQGIFTPDSMYKFIIELRKFIIVARKKENEDKKATLYIDFLGLKNIQVGGITVLSNMIELCLILGLKVVFRNFASCSAWEFLKNSGFASTYFDTAPISKNQEFLPLKLVEYDKSWAYIEYTVAPWLSKNFNFDIRQFGALKTCFMEIFNNISDHSSRSIGCSCAHYDENSGKLNICISDFGVGIPGRVKQLNPNLQTDVAAIVLACQEGFTTRTTPRNRGAGLHYLIQQIVERNSGKLQIYSGQGIYKLEKDKNNLIVPERSNMREGIYPGTLIYVTLQKSAFLPGEIEDEEFIWD